MQLLDRERDLELLSRALGQAVTGQGRVGLGRSPVSRRRSGWGDRNGSFVLPCGLLVLMGTKSLIFPYYNPPLRRF